MSDCPICYELVSTKRNFITTECGHSFHANCLMKHTSMNGYGCPCCRTQMVDSSLDEEQSQFEEINDGDRYVLDGCRWLFQRANHEPIDDLDPYTAMFERWQIQMEINNKENELAIERKTNLVLEELDKIKAFTFEDLVKGYLYWNQQHLYANSTIYEFNNRKVTSTLLSVLEKVSVSTA